MRQEYDVIIVGTGVAGLFATLHLPQDKQILLITKSEAEESDSFLAQGGICVLKNEDDYAAFFEDTLRAGHYQNNREAVDLMIRSSQEIICDLIDCDVEFEREWGDFVYTKEGAHTAARILYHEDLTGKEITSKLLSKVRELENVTLLEHTTMLDIIEKNNVCYGIVAELENSSVIPIYSHYTLWASGGVGGLYKHSTNYRHLTGDALAISMKHKIELENVDYVQIHPTTLYSEDAGRRFLISESVRGEGAVLLNRHGERFADELLPRDVLTGEIRKQMELDDSRYVYLSLRKIHPDDIVKRFPNIYKRCLEEGYDIRREPIPVVPAQHYFMGGVKVDLDGRTSMKHLYAAGETACNGVHGANRLASNSLLESLVWAKRAAKDMEACMQKDEKKDAKHTSSIAEMVSVRMSDYPSSYQEFSENYHELTRQRIEADKLRRQMQMSKNQEDL
ncbi:MAG: L-aspartate oxidase [Lachnospiraceae bacterium]|nr:L-aspartate oxidase [Lachnospiraceae bacterium]